MASPSETCGFHERVRQLAHDRLSEEEVAATRAHLETCRECRSFYRKKTASWFPQVENYTVVQKIGEGGFGVVYRAVHHAKERTEALKVLYGQTDLLTQYFENEVHLIAKLRHPNIAMLYDARYSDYPPYYAMEFVEGRSLDEHFRETRASLAERIRMIRKVADAVNYAHGQGVVHRDLKPQNILVDADGEPRIVDFGIAKRVEMAGRPDGEKSEGAIGTVGYIAPEQIAGERVDGRADIFALGALLFHCVTGEPARLAKDTERLGSVLRERSVSAPEDLAAIIRRCLATEPSRRYQTCGEFVADLDNYLEGRPIAARPNTMLPYRLMRVFAWVIRNHPGAIRASVVVVAAMLLTLTFSTLRARYTVPGVPGEKTMLIGFTSFSRQRILDGALGGDIDDLSLNNLRSLRMLHGELMERLSIADPLVVVWDYYFPTCAPEYDAAFIEGIRTISRKAPVVVGVTEFDINGQPKVCPEIGSEVAGFGALHAPKVDTLPDAFIMPVAIKRGMADPVPGIAVAAMAAARYPNCDPELRLYRDRCEVSFKKRTPIPGEPWRMPEVLTLDALWQRQADAADPTLTEADLVAYYQVPMKHEIWSGDHFVPYEDVLNKLSDADIKRLFDGKAILIGQMIAPIDQHRLQDGTLVYGCEVQATALDRLLSTTRVVAVSERGLGLRMLLGALCGLGLSMLPAIGRTWSLWTIGMGSTGVVLVGLALAVVAGGYVNTWLMLEVAMASSALLVGGGMGYFVRAIRLRQLQLAPEAIILSHEGASVATTVLAQPSG